MDDDGLSVDDKVEGIHGKAEARFHFHPVLQIQSHIDHKEGTALLPNGIIVSWHVSCGEARLETSTWHPRFGAVIPNTCLVIKLIEGASKIRFSWPALTPADGSL
jgi:hypothetical protein